MSFPALWEALLPAGRDEGTGGYRRLSLTPAEAACRAWFKQAAAERGLRTHADRNGNLWAWWDPPGAGVGVNPGPRPPEGTGPAPATRLRPGAVVTGSHLDSVPDGGAFDGPLGVAAGFAAVDALRAQGEVPRRPLAVVAFREEEGGRFGVSCLCSRLLTGAIAPAAARELRDAAGVTLAEAMAAAGEDPAGIGPDEDLLAHAAAYVELHIEQGRALAGLGAAVGIAERIWPHGRWRLDFDGRADHAGTTTLPDRHDPMLPCATAVLAAREAAARHGARATVGRVVTRPGAVNAVCSSVTAWLDARAPDDQALRAVVADVLVAAREAAAGHGVTFTPREESVTAAVEFDPALRGRLAATLAAEGISAPVLPTAAGHDAGILAARLPTAMLFVRNPTGVSHSPSEYATPGDCAAGVAALTAVLAGLACR
jgi:beta-ureidopropionase / N-carbamoyl-L-amino-acid hydrolase